MTEPSNPFVMGMILGGVLVLFIGAAIWAIHYTLEFRQERHDQRLRELLKELEAIAKMLRRDRQP